jgi:transposase
LLPVNRQPHQLRTAEAFVEVTGSHSEQALQKLVDREKRADIACRLRTVLLAKQGFTAPEIAILIGLSRRSVQFWVARYNDEGLDGLKNKLGRGRKPAFTAEQESRLCQRLDTAPKTEDGVCSLRGKDVQRILEVEFGKVRSLNAVYALPHKLGYSSLSPRPINPRSDPVAQDDFKKSSRKNLRKSKESTPAADSKSSSRMKQDSGSKGR